MAYKKETRQEVTSKSTHKTGNIPQSYRKGTMKEIK